MAFRRGRRLGVQDRREEGQVGVLGVGRRRVVAGDDVVGEAPQQRRVALKRRVLERADRRSLAATRQSTATADTNAAVTQAQERAEQAAAAEQAARDQLERVRADPDDRIAAVQTAAQEYRRDVEAQRDRATAEGAAQARDEIEQAATSTEPWTRGSVPRPPWPRTSGSSHRRG